MKVLGLADTHISAQITLGGAAPTVAGEPLVLAQSRRTMSWIAGVALDHDIDLIVHAGDVYESARPTPAEEAVAVNAVIELAEVAPTILLTGNHDRPKGGGVHALEPLRNIAPGRLVIADTPDPVFVVEHDGELLVQHELASEARLRAVVFPLPFPEKSRTAALTSGTDELNIAISVGLEALLAGHAVAAAEYRARGIPTIVALHGTMRGASFGCRVAPLGDIAVPVADYWHAFDVHVAGHIHQRQHAPGTVLSGYVGAPDRMDFGEANDVPGVAVFDVQHHDIAPPGTRFFEYDAGCMVVHEEHVPNPDARVYVTIDLGSLDEPTPLRAVLAAGPDAARLYRPDRAAGLAAVPSVPAGSGAGEPDPEDGVRDETVYRVRGDLPPDEHALLASVIRSWRAQRYIVANETTVAAGDRARVQIEEADIADTERLVDRVLVARPDLLPHRALVLEGLADVLG